MIEKRRLKPLFVLSSIGLLCLDGEAAWIYSTSKILDGIVLSPSDSRIICYIKTESGALEYFTSIDKALEVASKRDAKDQIFLKPTKSFSGDKFKKAVVEQNHVLNENDVFTLPWDADEHWDGRQKDTDWPNTTDDNNHKTFSDWEEGFVEKYLQSELVLKSGVSIENRGTIRIGGVVGIEGSAVSGGTTGNYTQITMESNSCIENYGNIECMGYIKEAEANNNGSFIKSYPGSRIYEPFVVYNFNGGSNTKALYDKKITPFSVYDMPNIRPKITFFSGSELLGYCDLYAGKQHNLTTTRIFGNCNALLNMTGANSKIETKHNPEDPRYTIGYKDDGTVSDPRGGKTSLDVFGGADFGSLKLSIDALGLSVVIDTSPFFFPISWKYDINLFDGLYTATHPLKFMFGSSLNVSKGASLLQKTDIIFYQYSAENAFSGDFFYPSVKENAQCIINGAYLVLSGGVGGFFEGTALNTKSTFFIDKNALTTVTVQDGDKSANVKGYSQKAIGPYKKEQNKELAKDYYDWNGEEWSVMDKCILLFEIPTFVNTNNHTFLPIKEITKGEVVQLPTDKPGIKTGICEFSNWNSASDLSGVAYQAGASLLIDDALVDNGKIAVLYPAWTNIEKAIDITYVPGDNLASGAQKTKGEVGRTWLDYTLKKPAEWSYADNMEFKDWFCFETFSTMLDEDGKSQESFKTNMSIENFPSFKDGLSLSFRLDGKEKTCLSPKEKILMADLSYKAVKNIKAGDLVLSFDHEKGMIVVNKILYNFNYKKKLNEILSLTFEDENVEISGDHGFFDLNLNKYIYINRSNVSSVVGHRFAVFNAGRLSGKTLTSFSARKEWVDLYCPVTVFHLNYFVGDLLSMPGGIKGCFNVFDYGEKLKYDEKKMKKDIERYGLLNYKECSSIIPKEIYDALPLCYMKVAMGKGSLSKWDLEYYMRHFYSLMISVK